MGGPVGPNDPKKPVNPNNNPINPNKPVNPNTHQNPNDNNNTNNNNNSNNNNNKNKKNFIKRFVNKAKEVKDALKNYFNRATIYKVDNSNPTIHNKTEDVKLNKIGQKYCQKFCMIGEVKKQCHEGKTKNCNKCILRKVPDTATKMKQNQLCIDICRQVKGSNHCKFFPFKMTIKRKKMPDHNELRKAAGI